MAKLLAGKLYNPNPAVTKGGALAALTAIDTTNLRLNFTVPASGIVMVRLACNVTGATTMSQYLLGVLEGSTVRGQMAPMGGLTGTAVATTHCPVECAFIISGLTPGSSLNWDAAYSCELAVAASLIKYGGTNAATASSDFGGFAFEIWDVTS